MIQLVETLLLYCLLKLICLFGALFDLRRFWYFFYNVAVGPNGFRRVLTSNTYLEGTCSAGRNTVLKTLLLRLKDMHNSYLYHDLRMMKPLH